MAAIRRRLVANLDAVAEFRDDSPRETDLEGPRGNCLGADRQTSRPRPASPQFPKLHALVCALEDFGDKPEASNEKILENIQMAWYEEKQ
jgi:FeS assembly protein IscX